MRIQARGRCDDRDPRGGRRPWWLWAPIARWILWAAVATGCGPVAPNRSSDSSSQSAEDGSNLSADGLYREFIDNPIDATARYRGQTLQLDGMVSEIVQMERGEAAVHLAAGGQRIAIAIFPRQDDLRRVRTGDRIRLRCVFDRFEYKTLWLSFCGMGEAQAGGSRPAGGSGVPSANLLYRDYLANPVAADAKHSGTVVEIEGIRGDLIRMSDGEVAIHIADGGKSNALVARFPDASAVAGVEEGQRFMLRCRVEKFEYLTLWLEGCETAR